MSTLRSLAFFCTVFALAVSLAHQASPDVDRQTAAHMVKADIWHRYIGG